MLVEYVGELVTKGFIMEKEDKKGKKHYELTDKGYMYVQDYKVIRNFLDSYGLA